ncbi:STAS domain-containing protein [Actinoplanes oblitus]|uniref:Anti-sigma factor antagonist n=1 Tax=Actinoplanes oblitus TaxID=3040509 RepID=A0ABY8WG10_9ACTN|nr:STAS domain-containing protein [Actinoplanes oblitus]WIM96804.1 STAS domain-containing protein [Actinoplanes oblitus]
MGNSIRTTLADDGTVTVTVDGEIDFSNADEVADGIRDAITGWSPPAVHVDLRDASFIDSTGLGALIEGYRAATESNIRYVVLNASPAFRRVLTVTGLSGFFGLTDGGEGRALVDDLPNRATGA